MEARLFLYGLERFGIKLGLDNIGRLMEAAGNPFERYPCIHVAGTNGKGSVLAMLDAILREAGYATCRYTSPHLLRMNERLLHNLTPVTDEALDKQIAWFRPVIEAMDPPPTFFEAITAVAFRWFAECAPDAALIEVGMGGRFDSTNVLRQPAATAVTNIDLEHTQYLGDTLEKIAFEKAGILKKGVPAIVSESRPGPRDVILERADEVGAPVTLLGRDFRYTVTGEAFDLHVTYESATLTLGPVPLGLAGRYQGANAATAVALAESLRDQYPRLDAQAVARGLEAARWPCRLEKVLTDPPVLIDVAHNEAGAAKLAEELSGCVLVTAVSSDKNAGAMVAALAPIAREIILSQFDGHRALPVDALSEAAGPYDHRATPDLDEAIAWGMERATHACPLLITGSIFTAAQARGILMERYGASAPQF
jgi:dihydrofolate synthase/folylpolyglutamate synthase